MSLDQDGIINEVALVDEASVLSQQGQPPRVNHTRNERPGAAGIGSYAVAIGSAVLTVAVLALFPVGYGGVATDGLGGYAAPGTRTWIRQSQYL